MSDSEHLVNQIIELERQNRVLKEECEHWQRLFRYEANERVQMLRWRKDFDGKGKREAS